MKLSNKYNIPQETVNKMVNDGVISFSWPRYEEIYEMYKKSLSCGKKKYEIYYEIAIKMNCSEYTIKSIVSKLDKI